MSHTAQTAMPQTAGAGGARRRRRPVWRAVGRLMMVGLLGVAIPACSPEPGIDGDEDAPVISQGDGDGDAPGGDAPGEGQGAAAGEQATSQPTDWDELREDLGVSPTDFRRRWNDAVDVLGAGAPLGEPTEVASAFRDLPTRDYPVAGLTTVEVVLTPQQDRVVMVGAGNIVPVGIQQRRDLVAVVTAAVSAATELSPAEARRRVGTDLDLTEDTVGEDHHGETARIQGVTAGVFAAHGTWEFFLHKKPE